MIKRSRRKYNRSFKFRTVNVRGNSTSLADKKAYNLKFDSSINPFGMGTAKKWSLLANIFDKNYDKKLHGT